MVRRESREREEEAMRRGREGGNAAMQVVVRNAKWWSLQQAGVFFFPSGQQAGIYNFFYHTGTGLPVRACHVGGVQTWSRRVRLC